MPASRRAWYSGTSGARRARTGLIAMCHADDDVIVVLAALILGPEHVALAPERLEHRPRPGQRVVDGGDLVTQQVLVLVIERDALVDDRLVVEMQRNAARLKDARALEV